MQVAVDQVQKALTAVFEEFERDIAEGERVGADLKIIYPTRRVLELQQSVVQRVAERLSRETGVEFTVFTQ